MMQKIKEYWKRSAFYEPAALLQKKLEDHRNFSASVFLFGAFLGVVLWVWDYITDPSGAMDTIGYRLLFLILLFVYWLIRRMNNPYLLATAALIVILITLADYMVILTYLKLGMLYGIAGFMFYMLLPPIALQAFPLLVNVMSIVTMAIFPHIIALLGFADGFEHENYAVLIWPAAIVAIMIQYFYAKEYHTRYELEKALQKLSYTDMLSGLYNRRYFMQIYEKELERAKRIKYSVTLLIVDIDRFKAVNDHYGHPTGDKVIQKIAEIFRQELRMSDTAARIGGEEFGILLPETPLESALAIADRLQMKVASNTLSTDGNPLPSFTVSIGAASFPDTDTTLLYTSADQALYRAKEEGRNRVVAFCNMDVGENMM